MRIRAALCLVVSASWVGCNCQSKVGAGGDSGSPDGGLPGDGGGGGPDSGPSSVHHIGCPGCPPFPDGGAPPCTGAGVDPQLVYPNDGALFPPNTNVIEVQFLPGAGNQYFEVDFENALTDVRVETQCNAITNAVGTSTGGCGLALDAVTWGYVASVNAGGAPVTVTVRATPDGSCVAGSNSRTMLFAAQPVQGAIYYWQSVVFGTLQGTSGGIYRYDFGGQAAAPSPFLIPSATSAFGNRCIGCHFISRDGQKMTFGNDDTDADDEYSDLTSSLLDVAAYATDGGGLTNVHLSPGFQTFAPDHSLLLGSDGLPKNSPAAAFLYNGTTGAAATPALVPTGIRGTQPDWSADGSKVVFVEPTTFLNSGKGMCTGCAQAPPPNECPTTAPYNCTCTPPTMSAPYDTHFFGGSLATMTASGGTFGTPAVLFASTGENNFYPAWAPDDAFIVFNRVQGAAGAAGDGFSNPTATIWALPAAGGTPVELTTLETGGVAADAGHPFPSNGLTNSWPRFSPFVQKYQGKNLYWVTFSSTRDYGLRVQNQIAGEINCFPPESPQNACSGKQQLTQPNCAQPQIWMAAITEDGLASGDTSFPAFWLPFQSIAAHNHIAQWATTLAGDGGCFEGGCNGGDAGTGDGGTCAGFNASCGAGTPCCAGFVCLAPSNTCQLNIQ